MKRTASLAFVVALVAATGVGMTGCASTRSTGQQIDDATVSASVKAKLAADPEVSAHEIDVDTVDGVVTLTGKVDSSSERAEAVDLARKTDGVVSVKNNLTVGHGPSVGEQVDDAGLATKVKAKLADDPMVKARNIDVDVVEGVVTLTGKVQSAAERLRAEQIASGTGGVRKVTNNLEIVGG